MQTKLILMCRFLKEPVQEKLVGMVYIPLGKYLVDTAIQEYPLEKTPKDIPGSIRFGVDVLFIRTLDHT